MKDFTVVFYNGFSEPEHIKFSDVEVYNNYLGDITKSVKQEFMEYLHDMGREEFIKEQPCGYNSLFLEPTLEQLQVVNKHVGLEPMDYLEDFREDHTLDVFESIVMTGGATIDPKTMRLVNFDVGYMVSRADTEVKFTTKGIFTKDLRLILEASKETFDSMGDAFKEDAYIGFWQDKGILYLDVSVKIEDLETALKVAKLNNQLAIYDNKNKESIYL